MKTKTAFLLIASMLLIFSGATANYLLAFQGDGHSKKSVKKSQQAPTNSKKDFQQSPLSPDMNPNDPTTQMNATSLTPLKIETTEEVGCKTVVSPMSVETPCRQPEKPKKSRSRSGTQTCKN